MISEGLVAAEEWVSAAKQAVEAKHKSDLDKEEWYDNKIVELERHMKGLYEGCKERDAYIDKELDKHHASLQRHWVELALGARGYLPGGYMVSSL